MEYLVSLGEHELGLFHDNGLILRSKDGTPIRGEEGKMRALYPEVPPGRFQPRGATVIVVHSVGALPKERLLVPEEKGAAAEKEKEKEKDSVRVEVVTAPGLVSTVEIRNPKP